MKKYFLILVATFCVAISSYANCSFAVSNIETTVNPVASGVFGIDVTVQPRFTPAQAGTYTIVVVPRNNRLSTILESQRMSVTMRYDGRNWVDSNGRTITSVNIRFRCRTGERPQCTVNDFRVYECF